ncbi:Homeobox LUMINIDEPENDENS -like protein [Gossypium arboreum]|uniref:Homeobox LUMINIDEPENDENS-like protein n=1 Tax=Gossypium arboreum TaxID=29729 RepID=A0A0B0ND86_GOSAR|nr:Homeobox LUMINIDEPENDENS -like protein [Gossypium arboreum]
MKIQKNLLHLQSEQRPNNRSGPKSSNPQLSPSLLFPEVKNPKRKESFVVALRPPEDVPPD